MKPEDIRQFLEFRKKFSKRQWRELEQAVASRLNEKADQLTLDDSDIQIVSERVEFLNGK